MKTSIIADFFKSSRPLAIRGAAGIAAAGLAVLFPVLAVPAPAQEVCPVNIDFKSPEASQMWRAVNDGVMGGRSSGGPRFDGGVMIFEGVINTNGGGFSSLRAGLARGVLSGQSAVKMRVKSDGRGYKLTLRSDAFYRGRNVAFQVPLPQTPAGEWAEVTLPFSALRPSIFGRPLSGPQFDPARARSIGIIIADGQDGPFKLEIEQMQSCAG